MMGQHNTPSPPTGLSRVIGSLIQYSEVWGKVWFGLVFWGCVLFAVSQRVWAHANNTILLIVSLLIGLSSGLIAHLRGQWL